MNKRILGGLAVAAMLAGGLATTSGMAQAIVQDDGPAACYEQVPYTVYQFSKTTTTPGVAEVSHFEYSYSKEVRTETFKTQYEIDKYVRDRTRTYTEGTDGKHYALKGSSGIGKDETPLPPGQADYWQVNTHQEPHAFGVYPIPGSTLHYVSAGSSGNRDWFYFTPGTPESYGGWTDWSAPYRWEPVGSHLKFVDVVPAANWKDHSKGEWTDTYQRQWSEYPTGKTREVSTGFKTETVFSGVVKEPLGEPWVLLDGYPVKVIDQEYIPGFDTTEFYNNGSVGPTDLAVDGQRNLGWTTDQTLDRSWKQIRTDEFMKDGDQIPCSEQPKDDFDLRTDNGTCEPGDDFVTVTQYRTNFTYALDDNFEWVRTQNGRESIAAQFKRELSEGEQEACVPPADDPSVTREDVGEPVCDTTTIKFTVTTITYTPEYIEGAWVQVASEPVVTEEVRNLTAGEQFRCPTTPTVAEQLPPRATPAAPVVVAANSPAQAPTTSAPAVVAANSPAQAPTTSAPAVSAGSLPATGSNGTGMTALLALLATSLGGGALLVARRRNVTT